MNSPAKLSSRYLDAFKSSLFQQSWLFLAAALLLESLEADLFVLAAIAGHWLLTLVIAVRRPQQPTRWDLLFCEFGFVPVALLTVALAPIVWRAAGDTTLYERWFGSILIADPGSLLPVQVVAGVWIVVYFVLEIFRRKAKVKRVKAVGAASLPADETVSKAEGPSDKVRKSSMQPPDAKRRKVDKEKGGKAK